MADSSANAAGSGCNASTRGGSAPWGRSPQFHRIRRRLPFVVEEEPGSLAYLRASMCCDTSHAIAKDCIPLLWPMGEGIANGVVLSAEEAPVVLNHGMKMMICSWGKLGQAQEVDDEEILLVDSLSFALCQLPP
ncbi:hypothetical protein EJB05_24480, partial [Eragrostis curvula]